MMYTRSLALQHLPRSWRWRAQGGVRGSLFQLHSSSSGWQDGLDPEDPWEEALDAFVAKKRRDAAEAAADREIAEDGVAMGWDGTMITDRVLLDTERSREDEGADWEFYDFSRLVFHADTDALNRLTAVYRELLPREGGKILDVGSSWVSHLPEDRTFARVVGIGMNEAELKSNPKLDSWQVQDLNLAPDMHLETETYDAVLISFAIQYFKFPEFLLAQIARALKPGGKLIISWGAGCFSSKAIKGWLNRDQDSRIGVVLRLLASAGFVDAHVHSEHRFNPTWRGADELIVVSAVSKAANTRQTLIGLF
jgi:SAM-dependent methyltransferase